MTDVCIHLPADMTAGEVKDVLRDTRLPEALTLDILQRISVLATNGIGNGDLPAAEETLAYIVGLADGEYQRLLGRVESVR